jgi:hypothetical protein
MDGWFVGLGPLGRDLCPMKDETRQNSAPDGRKRNTHYKEIGTVAFVPIM